MLNYKELDMKFTQLLVDFSKEDLQAWVEFDKQREMIDLLLNGEIVTFQSPEYPAKSFQGDIESISIFAGNYQYAMAA